MAEPHQFTLKQFIGFLDKLTVNFFFKGQIRSKRHFTLIHDKLILPFFSKMYQNLSHVISCSPYHVHNVFLDILILYIN
jgi:hypothetical protein